MAHLSCIFLLYNSMVIFQSQTVSLPEGKPPFSYGFSLWFSYGFPMVFLWFSYGFPIETSIFLWVFPMVFLWFSHWNLHFPMVFLWFSYGFPIETSIFLWFSYGFPMIFPLKPPFSYGFPMVFLWFSHWNLHFPRVKWNVPRSIETRDPQGMAWSWPGCLAAHGGRSLHRRRGWNAGGQA